MSGKTAALLFESEAVGAAALQEIDPQFPLAGDFQRWPTRRRRLSLGRDQQGRHDRVADLGGFARLQLERIDGDRTLAGAVVVEHDARLAVEYAVAQGQPVERVFVAVPDDLEPRHFVHSLGLDDLALGAGDARDALGDRGAILVPFLPLGRFVALAEPVFERGHDTDDVLLRHFHRPAQRLVRRAVAPGGLAQALVAEQKAARLRAAQELAAAVDDEIGAALQPRARPLDMLGGGVDHDRDAARLDDRGDLLEPHARQVLLLAEQHHHRDRLFQRLVELGAGVDLDDVAADHPHRLVIGEALLLRDDDPVDHAFREGEAQHLRRIVPGDAGGGAERDGGGAPAGDDAPFGAGQFGDALARRVHQLVEIDELARGGVHRGAHLRQHQAAAMHRAHAAAIDERPHAEREIGVGTCRHVTSDESGQGS